MLFFLSLKRKDYLYEKQEKTLAKNKATLKEKSRLKQNYRLPDLQLDEPVSVRRAIDQGYFEGEDLAIAEQIYEVYTKRNQ